MYLQSTATVGSSRHVRNRFSLGRLALLALACLGCAVANATAIPQQQLSVAVMNSFPNGALEALTMPNQNSASIAALTPILTGGSPANLYSAVTWVTNPTTNTLDLVYADAEQHKIWRLPGPKYQTPIAIFSWSSRTPGPAYPVGLSADPSGNIYAISPSSAWGTPGVWVLPMGATGNYGSPLLIDNTFTDPATHKPALTLALAEVTLATSSATTASSSSTPAWNGLDLLVLVGDSFNTRVIRYSQAQIESVLSTRLPLKGPTSTVISQGQFQTQATNRIPPIPVGMDVAQDPNTQDATVLVTTLDGRILEFDSTKGAFITPYAKNLGFGLTKIRVGTFQAEPYAFVVQLPGRILEFAAPAPGHSNTAPFAAVTKGVVNPSGLAVTQAGSTTVNQCVNQPCTILPQLTLEITGPGTVNIPANTQLVVDSCTIAADPRVVNTDGIVLYTHIPLDLSTLCAGFPSVLLSSNVFGASGPTGAGMSVAKISSAVLNEFQTINGQQTTPINNTLTSFDLNPALVLGNNPPCGSANGPVVAWGPIPGQESLIPEGVLIDITVACTPDPPPAGRGNHPSVLVQGTVLGGLSAAYIDSEFSALQQAFNGMITPAVSPPATQIVDPTQLGLVNNIQNYITQSQNYFNQENYNCALNQLATGARYVNTTVTSNPGDFLAGPPPSDDENPSGTLLMRFDHLYYDVNIWAGNPPITTDALNSATVIPSCGALNGPSGLAIDPNYGYLYVANYNNGQVLTYAPIGANGRMVQVPSMTITGFTNPVRLAVGPLTEGTATLAGDLIVSDTGTNLVSIYSLNAQTRTWTKAWTVGQPPQTAALTRPLGVAADENGNLYVAENMGQGNSGTGNVNDIKSYSFVTGAPALSGTYTQDSSGVAFQSVGDLYFSPYDGDLLVGLPSQVTFYIPFAGQSGNPVQDDDQPALSAGVNGAIGLANDQPGNWYVSNFSGTQPVTQYQANTNTLVGLTLVGTPPPAIQNPQGIVIDSQGFIYVSNTANNLIYVYTPGVAGTTCQPNTACYLYTIQ